MNQRFPESHRHRAVPAIATEPAVPPVRSTRRMVDAYFATKRAGKLRNDVPFMENRAARAKRLQMESIWDEAQLKQLRGRTP